MTTKRWTDEMLDKLASTVSETGEQIREMQGTMKEMQGTMKEMQGSIGELRDTIKEVRDTIEEVRDTIDGLRVSSQGLFQLASQHQRSIDEIKEEQELSKKRQAENDQRFYTLLEEIRYLNRRNNPDNNSNNS